MPHQSTPVLNNQPDIHYIHSDHLNTPQRITNTAQQTVWAADYQPFGEASITTASITNPLRFPGQYYDEETNLHYNYFRDYDPTTGRYIQSDPIGLGGGMNTYGYVGGNPVNLIDPEGLYGMWIFGNPLGGNQSTPYNPKKDLHNDRNKRNKCPKKEPKGGCDDNGDRWSLDELGSSAYHGSLPTYRGTGQYDGSQCVYDNNGKLVDSGPYMGTYDYVSPYDDDGDPDLGLLGHVVVDVLTHEIDSQYTPHLTEQF